MRVGGTARAHVPARLLACVLTAVAACALAAPVPAWALRAVAAKSTDAMLIKSKGRLLEIRSPSGVGSGELQRGKAGWPAALKVRLKGLKQLEHFRMTAGDLTFVCVLERLDGVQSQRVCRLGEEGVEPPREVGPDFEVTVPPELLATQEESIVVEWVDSWR